jgi:hypothetical protein
MGTPTLENPDIAGKFSSMIIHIALNEHNQKIL